MLHITRCDNRQETYLGFIYLGVTIDRRLTWAPPINRLKKKLLAFVLGIRFITGIGLKVRGSYCPIIPMVIPGTVPLSSTLRTSNF